MADHTTDADCTVDPDLQVCIECGADHSDPCPTCGGRGFHAELSFDATYRVVSAYRALEVEGRGALFLSSEEFARLVDAVDQASATMHAGGYAEAIALLAASPIHPAPEEIQL